MMIIMLPNFEFIEFILEESINRVPIQKQPNNIEKIIKIWQKDIMKIF